MAVDIRRMLEVLNALKDLRPLVVALPTDLELKALQDELIAEIKKTKT